VPRQKLLPGRSSGSAPAPARCRAAPESERSCRGQSRAPDWTLPPGCADSPNPGSLRPFEPPKPRSRRRCAVAPVRACHCRRISERSVCDAMLTESLSLRWWRPPPALASLAVRRLPYCHSRCASRSAQFQGSDWNGFRVHGWCLEFRLGRGLLVARISTQVTQRPLSAEVRHREQQNDRYGTRGSRRDHRQGNSIEELAIR
jgi:hypothetical protein